MNKRLFWCLALAGVLIGCILFAGLLDTRSVTGHLLRRVRGKAGAEQTVNDLAGDLRHTEFVNRLQVWSIETLSRFNAGSPVGNSSLTPNLPLKSIVIPEDQLPSFIKEKWQNVPEVVLLISTNHKATSILLDWYSYGVVVGPSDLNLEDLPWEPYYTVNLQAGVYVVWVDTK